MSDNQTLADVGITGQGTVYVYVMHSVRAKIPEERVGTHRTGQPAQWQQQPSQQDQPAAPSHQSPIPAKNPYQGNDPRNLGSCHPGGYPLEQPVMYRGGREPDIHQDAVSPHQRPQEVGGSDIWAMPSHPAILQRNNHSPDPPNSPQMEVNRQDQLPQAQAPPPNVAPQQQLAHILCQGLPPPLKQPEQPPPKPAPPPEKVFMVSCIVVSCYSFAAWFPVASSCSAPSFFDLHHPTLHAFLY